MDAQQRAARAVHRLAWRGSRSRAALRRDHGSQLGIGLRPAVILNQQAAGTQRETRRRGILSQRRGAFRHGAVLRSEEHTSELQSQSNLVCRLLLEKKKKKKKKKKSKKKNKNNK